MRSTTALTVSSAASARSAATSVCDAICWRAPMHAVAVAVDDVADRVDDRDVIADRPIGRHRAEEPRELHHRLRADPCRRARSRAWSTAPSTSSRNASHGATSSTSLAAFACSAGNSAVSISALTAVGIELALLRDRCRPSSGSGDRGSRRASPPSPSTARRASAARRRPCTRRRG